MTSCSGDQAVSAGADVLISAPPVASFGQERHSPETRHLSRNVAGLDAKGAGSLRLDLESEILMAIEARWAGAVFPNTQTPCPELCKRFLVKI